MTDYTELVKALRCDEKCWDNRCKYLESSSYNWCNTQRLRSDAAAAIEELEDALADECKECDYLVDENARLTTENKELQAQLPKLGEWVRVEDGESYHYECSECGERPLYSRFGDIVLSGVCPMCGAYMRKMEVQE